LTHWYFAVQSIGKSGFRAVPPFKCESRTKG
jgi:hypothetical protein